MFVVIADTRYVAVSEMQREMWPVRNYNPAYLTSSTCLYEHPGGTGTFRGEFICDRLQAQLMDDDREMVIVTSYEIEEEQAAMLIAERQAAVLAGAPRDKVVVSPEVLRG